MLSGRSIQGPWLILAFTGTMWKCATRNDRTIQPFMTSTFASSPARDIRCAALQEMARAPLWRCFNVSTIRVEEQSRLAGLIIDRYLWTIFERVWRMCRKIRYCSKVLSGGTCLSGHWIRFPSLRTTSGACANKHSKCLRPDVATHSSDLSDSAASGISYAVLRRVWTPRSG